MLIAVGIVAHESRIEHATKLATNTNATIINIDDGTLGCTRNHWETWNKLTKHATNWSVVLEDDALPIPNFPHQLNNMLTHTPAPITGLYLGTSRPPQHQKWMTTAIRTAYKTGTCYTPPAPALFHGVGTAIRTNLIPDMLAHIKTTLLPIDEAISSWARARGHQIVYSVPSIIDHADIPTLVQHRDNTPRTDQRRAHHTGGRLTWHTP